MYCDLFRFSVQYQFGCGILKMVGPKKQDIWPKISILEGNYFILWLQGAPVRQKLGMILENKEENIEVKKWSPKLIFINKKRSKKFS